MPRQFVDIDVQCAACARATLKLPRVAVGGLDAAEQWDAAEKLLPSRGWAVSRTPWDARCAVCPACLDLRRKAESNALPPLARYDPSAACPKCSTRQPATRWCNGRTSQCGLNDTREHLHRTCGCCGFDWPQAPLDAKPAAGPPPKQTKETTAHANANHPVQPPQGDRRRAP